MAKYIYKLVLIICFIVSVSACTTTTKTVSTGYSVESGTQLEKAKAAFNQKNYSLAAKLLEPLANKGQGYAQYALGYMYYNGMGVPRNRSLAIQLLNASASNGNKNAIEALRLLSPAVDNTPHVSGVTSPPPGAGPNSVMEVKQNEKVGSLAKINQPVKNTALSVEADTSDELEDIVSTMDQKAIPAEMEESKAPDAIEQQEIPEKHTVTTSVEDPESVDSLTEREKWIISQPDSNYTIQLLVSGNESAMQQYIVDNDLQDSAIYYKSPNNSVDLFILIQGSFESFSQATKTISSYSTEMKKAEPWVRSIAAIKKTLLAR